MKKNALFPRTPPTPKKIRRILSQSWLVNDVQEQMPFLARILDKLWHFQRKIHLSQTILEPKDLETRFS